MKRILLITISLTLFQLGISGHDIVYTKSDSIRIEEMLKKAVNRPTTTNRLVYFGKQFIGVPYVAHTLEVGESEKLIVNTRELDCTTFLETVVALALCDKQNKRTFSDYCKNLRLIRYRNGKNTGYPSRLHYFAFWADDNEKKGIVYDILDSSTPYTKAQTLNVDYMSKNPEKYKHLKNNTKYISEIKAFEDKFRGVKVRYIPKEYFNLPKSKLKYIKDGDIVGLVTKKSGLDTSHLGIAVWQNGRLHLLNASYLRKKVVLEKQTLHKYSQGQNSQLGMRLLRLK